MGAKVRCVWDFNQAGIGQLVETFANLADECPASHGADHIFRGAPTELLGDFVAHSFGTLGIEGAEVDIHKTPTMVEGDLRAEAVLKEALSGVIDLMAKLQQIRDADALMIQDSIRLLEKASNHVSYEASDDKATKCEKMRFALSRQC